MSENSIEGLLLVDKAKGSSSFKVVSKVRRALATRAVGHVGTLDPLASGLLVFLIGRYTRLSNYLMAGTKVYEAVIELGVSTNTDDKEGEILEQACIEGVTKEAIEQALPSFLGPQEQIPPIFSAISVHGVRSYKRARAGEAMELPARPINIFSIDFISYEAPLLTVKVSCSKGTYIRALARDIGVRLSVPAHLADLRRTECSEYDVAHAISENDLEDKMKALSHLQSGVTAIKGLETVTISNEEALELRSGRRLTWNKEVPANADSFLAVMGDEPVAICRLEASEIVSVRGFGAI